MSDAAPPLTRLLASFVVETDAAALPANVLGETVRSFVNFFGCALGGARQDSVERAVRAAVNAGLAGDATLIGRPERLTPLDAAMVNCHASAAYAFDDTHLSTVLHPTGPVAGPLLAEAERRTIDGETFVAALAIGLEVECRVAKMLTVPPAEPELGWYMTSVAGPLGAAAAIARVRGLDVERTGWALGLAGTQSAGHRQNHGSMCTSLSPGLAARAGYWAALLAEEGVTSSAAALEGANGFAQLFAKTPCLPHAADELGRRWDMLDNVAKPYPCGIVIHPSLDACLDIASTPGFAPEGIGKVELFVNPLCLMLTDRPDPPDAQLAQVSLQHWTAAALSHGAAGIEEGEDACVRDPNVAALRARIDARPDDGVGRDGARVRVTMDSGETFERTVEHGIGSLDRPMTDAELDRKFLDQAARALPPDQAEQALAASRGIATLADASNVLAAAPLSGG